MRAPRGRDEIYALYGDPRKYVREDGTVSPIWEARMVSVKLPIPLPLGWNRNQFATRVRVNQAIAEEVDALFLDWEHEGCWPLLETYDGGYTFRMARGSSRLSMHALGGALDFDAWRNKLGTRPKMNPRVVRVAAARGWTWGGKWRRPDGMHFQFGRGY